MPKFFPLRAVPASVTLTVLSHRMVRINGVCIENDFFKEDTGRGSIAPFDLYVPRVCLVPFHLPLNATPLCRLRLFPYRTDSVISRTRVFLAGMMGGWLQTCRLRSREIAICHAHYSIRLWALTSCFRIKEKWRVISQCCASD